VADHFGMEGRLVRIVHAGEALDLPRLRLLVKTFDVSLGANLDRTARVNFHEILNDPAVVIPGFAVGRNDRGDGGAPVTAEDFATETHSFDVLVPVFSAESQPFG